MKNIRKIPPNGTMIIIKFENVKKSFRKVVGFEWSGNNCEKEVHAPTSPYWTS